MSQERADKNDLGVRGDQLRVSESPCADMESELAEQERRLGILLRSARTINEVLETPIVMRNLIALAMEITKAASGSAGLMEDGKMVFREYNKEGALLPIYYEFAPGYGIPGWIEQNMRPYLSNDVDHDPIVIPEVRDAMGVHRLVDIPIVSRTGELLGCFEVYNKVDGRPFDDEDIRLLQGLAESTAVALENARMVAEMKEARRAEQEVESKYRSLVEESVVGVYIIQGGLLVYANPRLAEIFGYSPSEIVGKKAMETVAPQDRALVEENIRKRLTEDVKSLHYEFHGLRKDGMLVDVEVYGSRISYQERPAVIGTMLDITDRKHAEESLRESEEKFRMLAENAEAVIGIIQGRNFVYANPYLEKISGYTREELLSIDIAELIAPEFRGLVLDRARRRLMGESVPSHYEFRMIAKHGGERWMDLSLARIDFRGSPAVAGVAYDITERRKAEISLARLAAIVEATTDLASIADLEGNLLYLNRAGREMLGIGPRDGLMGINLRDAHSPYSVDIVLNTAIPTALREGAWQGETEIRALDGHVIPTSQVIIAFKEPDTGHTLLATILRDITELKRTEEASRRAADKFRTIFEAAPAAIMIYDRDAIVREVNPAFEEISHFAKDQLVGRSMYDTFADIAKKPLLDAIIERALSGETIKNVEWMPRRPDGSTYYVLANTTPLANEHGVDQILALAVDITDRRMAEQRNRELEEHKRDFYRRTILAATEGKLVITERGEISRLAGPALAEWTIISSEQLGMIRANLAALAQSLGMDDARVFDFVLCAGEATTNVVKHAKSGAASLHKEDDALMLIVTDNGPGIDALALPEVALKRGYTTAVSLGMGYKEMISLADKVYLATGPGGTTVATEMFLHPREVPLAAICLPDAW